MHAMNILLFCCILQFAPLYVQSSLLNIFGRTSRDDCYVRVRSDLKLRDIHVAQEVSVGSLSECKRECDLAFFSCESFSYNHNFFDRLRKNCLLSRRHSKTLSTFSSLDFEDDDDFDFYEREDRFRCNRGILGFTSQRRTTLDNCFRMTRRREGLTSQSFIRRSLRSNDREDCERSCLMESSFICRGFYFKYSLKSSFLREDNCHLTSLENYADRSIFYDSNDFNFYERMGYHGECNSYGLHGFNEDYRNYDYRGYRNMVDCFRLERQGYRFDLISVRKRLSVRHLEDCKFECQRTRSFECRSLAFRDSFSPFAFSGENCLLSEKDMRSLGTRYDLVPDSNFNIYTKEDESYGRCLMPRDDYGGGTDDFYYGREGGYETVKGVRCLSQCRLDRFSRYFYCEVDQLGYWDYCCRPGSVCAYDFQVQFNRCEVGFRSATQWQPCYDTLAGGLRRAFLQKTSNATINQIKVENSTDKDIKKEIEVANLNDII